MGNALRFVIMKKYVLLEGRSVILPGKTILLTLPQPRRRVLRLRHPPSFRGQDEHPHPDLW